MSIIRSLSSMKRCIPSQICSYRKFCSPINPLIMTPAVRLKNSLTAISLVVGVVGVYYMAMFKMKEGDDLDDIIQVETRSKGTEKI